MGKTYCFFSAQYLPTVGGVERYTYNLAKLLCSRGNKAIVVTSALPNMPAYEVDENGIIIYRLPCFSLFGGRMPVVKINHTFREALKKLAQENIDCGIVQTQIYTSSAVGARFFAKQGIPAIVINHGTNHMKIGNALTSFAGRIYEHLNTAAIKHYCKKFYGVSQSCNQWLAHFGIAADDTLYNSIDPAQLQHLAQNADDTFRITYNIPQDARIICFTGRLVAEKGAQKLVEAYTLLSETLKANSYLVIAGDGALMPQLQQQASKHIILTGSLPFAKVVPLLCDSDIFCLPTDYPEGLPTSVLEAIACKCFVITTTRGGSKELITDETYGIILQENTPEQIASALTKALSNSDYCKSAAEKSYARLLETFTWEATCTKLEQIDWNALH